VSRDASLTDFADGSGGAEAGGTDGSEADADGAESPTDEDTPDAEAIETPDGDPSSEPATSGPTVTTTFESNGKQRPCDACGDPTRRRWRDDGNAVCAECKEW
jgi:hypothetical protein